MRREAANGFRLVLTISSFLLTAILFVIACSTDDQLSATPVHTISPELVLTADSLESLLYFGAISDVACLSDGSIAVLDRLTAQVMLFNQQGDFLHAVGGLGEGPHEFSSPDALVPINSGSFFVLDKSAQRVTEFGNDGSLIDNVETLSGSFPSWPVNCGSGEFIGGFTAIDASGNDFNLAYRVCSFTIDLAVIDTLFTNSVPLNDYSDITYTLSNTIYSCAFTADTMGNVFIAPISTSEYSIYGYDTDNVQFLQIENELPRIGKSSAEIASEAERINSALRARNPGYSGSYTPCEYRYMIQPQGLHADNAGRLWVLRGTSANPVYDVYDYQGRHLFEVSVMGLHPEDTSDVLWWCISSQKILAFSIDPVNEPVVYVFNITF